MGRTPGARPLLTRDINFKQRQARALEMRIEGYTQHEIANAVGVSQSAVSRMLRRALDERTAERVDDLRTLEYERGEALHRQLWQQAKNGNTGAAGVLTRLMDRRAKLLGLDPQREGEGGKIHHDYFAHVLIYTSEEADRQLAELRRLGEAWNLARDTGNASFAGDMVVPAELAAQGQDGAIEAAQRATAAVMPQKPVYMQVVVFHHNYRPVGPTRPFAEMVDDEGRPLGDTDGL